MWRKYIAASGGSAVSRCRKKKYRLLEENIQRLYSKLERMSLLQFLSAASHFCKETYSRVALREDVRGDVLELEDMEVPAGDPQDPLDPLEGGETPAAAEAPAPRGRAHRGRAPRAGAARGAAREAARADGATARGAARGARGARRQVLAHAGGGADPEPAAPGHLPDHAEDVANPEPPAPEPAGPEPAGPDVTVQAPPDQSARPVGRTRRARATVRETLPRVARVTRRSPAIAAARELRAVERQARAAQLEREAEAEANRQLLQFQEEFNAGKNSSGLADAILY